MIMEIQIFKNESFGEVRTIVINGEPWFCLKDVCNALALDGKQVNRRLEDGVVSKHPITDNLGRIQMATFVNEDGLYDAILDSRKAEARQFRKWVTSEVLPSIRRTGAYLTQDFCMRVLNAEGTVTTTQIAQDYGMTAHDLNQILVDMKLVYPCGGQLVLYARYKRRGYAKSETELYARYDGKAGARMVTRWTQTGRMWLYETLKKKGIRPKA